MSREEVCGLTKIDPWFIRQLEEMLEVDSRDGQDIAAELHARIDARIETLRGERRGNRQALEREVLFRARAQA